MFYFYTIHWLSFFLTLFIVKKIHGSLYSFSDPYFLKFKNSPFYVNEDFRWFVFRSLKNPKNIKSYLSLLHHYIMSSWWFLSSIYNQCRRFFIYFTKTRLHLGVKYVIHKIDLSPVIFMWPTPTIVTRPDSVSEVDKFELKRVNLFGLFHIYVLSRIFLRR